jgi:thiol-disulfide isomerase/thioredoxin
MNAISKFALFVVIVGFIGGMYFLFFVYEPPNASAKAYHRDTVANYLDAPPEIPEKTTPMLVGQLAPDFSFACIDNKVVKLSEYRGNKPVVLDFWATWCGPCRMELPTLQEFYSQYSDKVHIIAISSEGNASAAEIRSVAHNDELSFDVVHDPSRTIDALYPHNAIPFLVFIGKDGKVLSTATGYNPEVGKEIQSLFGL